MTFVPKPIPSRDVLDDLLGQLKEFIQRVKRNVLVVEPELQARERIVQIIGANNVEVLTAQNGAEALRTLDSVRFDCLVVNPAAIDLADGLASSAPASESPMGPPAVIVYGEHQQGIDDHPVWKRLQQHCQVRRVYSPERLLDLAMCYLHRPVA